MDGPYPINKAIVSWRGQPVPMSPRLTMDDILKRLLLIKRPVTFLFSPHNRHSTGFTPDLLVSSPFGLRRVAVNLSPRLPMRARTNGPPLVSRPIPRPFLFAGEFGRSMGNLISVSGSGNMIVEDYCAWAQAAWALDGCASPHLCNRSCDLAEFEGLPEASKETSSRAQTSTRPSGAGQSNQGPASLLASVNMKKPWKLTPVHKQNARCTSSQRIGGREAQSES